MTEGDLRYAVECATTTAAAHIEMGAPPESYWHVLTALNLIRKRAGIPEREIPPLPTEMVVVPRQVARALRA